MSWLQAIVLGLIQGLTEFLPISSSGHLILASRWLGWPDQGLSFDTAANSGSLLAVIFCFRGDLHRLLAAVFARSGANDADRRLAAMLAVATVPVALAGWTLQELIAGSARSVGLIAAASISFGLLLGWADRRWVGEGRLSTLSWRAAFGVGLMQALALVPGTSRAGVTITAGLFAGLSRPAAIRFSFLLAVPVGLLVAVKDVVDLVRAGGNGGSEVLVGFAASASSAYLAIRWLLAWARRRDLMVFVVYRVVLGLLLLAT